MSKTDTTAKNKNSMASSMGIKLSRKSRGLPAIKANVPLTDFKVKNISPMAAARAAKAIIISDTGIFKGILFIFFKLNFLFICITSVQWILCYNKLKFK